GPAPRPAREAPGGLEQQARGTREPRNRASEDRAAFIGAPVIRCVRGSSGDSALPLKRRIAASVHSQGRAASSSRQPARARIGHAATSAIPPAALARNALPAPYRWNTAPSATPP